MVFASWYSIQKNLPDAKVLGLCQRTDIQTHIFRWPIKCKFKFFQYPADKNPLDFAKINNLIDKDDTVFEISSTTLAVREYEKLHLGPSSAKSDDFTTFVDYSGGCGKFVVSDWIHKSRNPFVNATQRFTDSDMTVNEAKVLKLFEQMANTYSQVA